MTAQLLWDGTFSTEAVATAGLARLDQLHAEAMATIAALAENWDRPAPAEQPVDEESTSWSDPETWSAEDDELPEEDDDDAPVLLAVLPPLPPLLRRPRQAPDVTTPNVTAPAGQDDARQLASA